MIKYATRFKQTRNLDDLKKVSDYAHLLCGLELSKVEDVVKSVSRTTIKAGKRYCVECGEELGSKMSHCNFCFPMQFETNDNRCVSCGDVIPEGTQYCQACFGGLNNVKKG
jgi:hypothetical protein